MSAARQTLFAQVTMDDTPPDHGAPVYLKGSHFNDKAPPPLHTEVAEVRSREPQKPGSQQSSKALGDALRTLRMSTTHAWTLPQFESARSKRLRLLSQCPGSFEVQDSAVFVDLEEDDLLKYEPLEFQPKAGDLLVWHARSIHKIDGPTSQDWGKSKRRVLGGTVAVDDSKSAPTPGPERLGPHPRHVDRNASKCAAYHGCRCSLKSPLQGKHGSFAVRCSMNLSPNGL